MATEITVTDFDRDMAREAMNEGHTNCVRRINLEALRTDAKRGEPCDCDLGATNGCKERVEAIAKAIATARKM